MICINCSHERSKRFGKNRNGSQRFRCLDCGQTWTAEQPATVLGPMRLPVDKAKLALRLLTEGGSIRSTERVTGIHRDTLCKLIVYYGDACRRFMDQRMRDLKLTHLQIDEQWTWVGKKQGQLTYTERERTWNQGDIYIWTCIDKKTKLLPVFMFGKRSADNARRFMVEVSRRVYFPQSLHYMRMIQVSTDAFAGYREAVDLAFGPYVRYGQIRKQFRSARLNYTPAEIVGVERTPRRNIPEQDINTISTSHVERLNGTQRLFLKRLNRLTYCFSKKLRNLEAAFAMFAAYYNYCWQTRKPGKSGAKRDSAAMMAGIADHVWSFDELFETVLSAQPSI